MQVYHASWNCATDSAIHGWLIKKTNEDQNGRIDFGTRKCLPPQIVESCRCS